ncbi:LuxR C-terminal-related transcriptional regulator [Nocardia sp. NPDC023988]|uniref:ATP-binding protein n=1 Tax=unclassified Nocardia TaxID=2637762 RepID=UPI0033EC7B71
MVRSTLDPAATSYLGRDAEVAAVRALLDDGCLVSITGQGGLGKTRLARKVAGQLAADYDDGVYFVELSGLRHDDEVGTAVAAALRLRIKTGESATERVLDHLVRRAPLLVLDNCEHLLDGCADLVIQVLATCPGVTLLVTSRQTLSVAGEQVYRLPPLPVPPPGLDDPARIAAYPAAALLVDRARAVRADFRITESNAADIAHLCRLLDGIPLAIELAAARHRSLSPAQVIARWSCGLTLPTAWTHGMPDRHQTLRNTVDWSYRLCTDDEKQVWARLSIFQDWFELEAAEYVCADTRSAAPVVSVVDSLVDKSILERRGDDITHYRLLRPVREFGAEKLTEEGRTEVVARRHRDWFRDVILLADREFFSKKQYEHVRRLQVCQLDLRLALEWSLETPGEAETALEMAACLDEFWRMAGSDQLVKVWLQRALHAVPHSPHAARGWAVLALHSIWMTDRDSAYRELDQADREAARSGDPVVIALAKAARSAAAKIDLDNEQAAALASEATHTLRSHGHLRESMGAWNIYALATAAADPAGRLQELREAVRLCEEHGDYYYRGLYLFAISLIEVMLGNPDAAERAGHTALRISRRWGSRFGDAYHVETLAWVASARNQHLRAATLFGVAAAAWEQLGSDPDVILVRPHTLFRDASIQALGDDRFETAFLAGQAMPVADAFEFALTPHREPATRHPVDIAPLTPREYEVATLIATGLTNKEIAARLVIAPRTADTHVGNILTKLGSSNRAQIATWVATRGADAN